MSFVPRDSHPFDSGYSSSSTNKKEKSSGGLLGSLKELFGKKAEKSRKPIIPTTSNGTDIADNYNKFKRNEGGNQQSSNVSPYEMSPDFFFSNQGVKKTSDLFKPKQFEVSSHVTAPKEKPVDFEIPMAIGPARKSIVGIFDDPPPNATPPMTHTNETTMTTDFLQTVTPHVFADTPKALSQRSSVSSHSTLKPQENGTPRALSHKSSASSMQSAGFSNLSMVKISSEESQENIVKDEPVVIKTLSPQDSDLSVKSDGPHTSMMNKEISRAYNRRGSLSNSIVSDISANSSERSEGRRNRRRSGPKLLGPQIKKQDGTDLSEAAAPVSHILPSIPPPVLMGDPRYMPYHPYMLPHAPDIAQYMPPRPNEKQHMNRQQYSHEPPPLPLHNHPQAQYPMYHHPDMYGGYGGMPPLPPPQVMMPPFPPVMEEGVEGSTTSGRNRSLQPLQPKKKRAKPVQRSKTMDPSSERPKVESRKKKTAESDKDEPEGGVKGFDDFALY